MAKPKRYFVQFFDDENEKLLEKKMLEDSKNFKSKSATFKHYIELKSYQEMIENYQKSMRNATMPIEFNMGKKEHKILQEKYDKLVKIICTELVYPKINANGIQYEWVDQEIAKKLKRELSN